jgi:hypothetical protein
MPEEIKLSEITYKESFYPRQKPNSGTIEEYAEALDAGAKFPPIILAKEVIEPKNGDGEPKAHTNLLLDGYHRWKAYVKANEGKEESEQRLTIPVEFHEIPEGVPVKLYALSLSAKHGLRVTNGDKEAVCRECFEANEGIPIKTLASYCSVTFRKAKDFLGELLGKFEETKKSHTIRLDMLGWTQQEIADQLKTIWPEAIGTSQDEVSRFLRKNGNDNFCVNIQTLLSSDLTPKTVSERVALPEQVIWAVKLRDMDDQSRFDELKIPI